MAALKVEGMLRLNRGTMRQLVHAGVHGRGFFLELEVEIGGGELVAQKIKHLGRMLDLALLVVEFLHGLVAAAVQGENLQLA